MPTLLSTDRKLYPEAILGFRFWKIHPLEDKLYSIGLGRQIWQAKLTLDKEKLDWFEIVNIAGETLSDQELRNSVYTGAWLSDAKAFFSKRNGAGENLGKKYLKGDFVRQTYLETSLDWINNDEIREYMAAHQGDKDADELKTHFKKVISWVENTLIQDEDVSNRKGIYAYVLSGEEKFLNIRSFKDNTKREAYEQQKGVCVKCKKKFRLEEMEVDHIAP